MKFRVLEPEDNLPKGDDPWDPWYDKAFKIIVRAEMETQARQLANKAGGAETGEISHSVYRTGGDPWLDPKYSSCKELAADGEAEVIVAEIHTA